MKKTVQLCRTFPTDSKNLFAYFVEADLRQQWLPQTVTLKEIKPYASLLLKTDELEVKYEFESVYGGTRIHVTLGSQICEFTWIQKMGRLKALISKGHDDCSLESEFA